MSNPRNPALFAFLKQTMRGGVKISRQGEPCRYQRKQRRDGAVDIEVYDGGEEYAVCCPLCGDTRFRCYVNHKFDTEIEGAEVLYPVHCWNEECQSTRGLAKYILERYRAWKMNYYVPPTLDTGSDEVRDAPMTPEETAKHSAEKHAKLSGVQKLTSLLTGHPATEYLRTRGFDPLFLENMYGVGYKGKSQKYALASSRLFIPIMWGKYEVGWQARAIPGHTNLTLMEEKKNKPWPYKEPKYFTSPGFTKGRFLYNMEQAKEYDVVVVVEGITDAWKVGPWAVAMLGKSLSYDQIHNLASSCFVKKSWIVMLTDEWTANDVAASWRKNFFNVLGAYPLKNQVRMMPVPKGDPGDYTGAELVEMTNHALRSKQEDLVR